MKKLWKKRARRVGKIAASLIGSYAAMTGLVAGANSILDGSERTAVFVGGKSKSDWIRTAEIWGSASAMYLPVTLRETLRGRNTDWYEDLNAGKVHKKIFDPRYQNIVFIGHGQKECFWARNGPVHSDNVRRDKRYVPKTGELLQYTCGKQHGGISLAEAILSDGRRSFSHNDDVRGVTNYFYAWINVFRSFDGE